MLFHWRTLATYKYTSKNQKTVCFACERYSNNYHQAFVGNLITSLLLLMEQLSSMKCELTDGPLPVFCQIHLGLVSSHSVMGPAPPRCPCPWCWLRCTCRRSDQDGKVPARENGASSLTLPRRCLQDQLHVPRSWLSQSRPSPPLGSPGSGWPRPGPPGDTATGGVASHPLTAGASRAHLWVVSFPTLPAELSLWDTPFIWIE